ncbi:hypothetical protein NHX12_002076 [Muraenolepis orangiensis]|uniref:Ig-like domain-containing protein n=1 Tax=Muraenolepis orangiensis TaxID=630683 RepID=A0A9Q0E0W9_9TELE|nr:hypothetical protein NHX12_002076 [Muraenolepis orangiensis]
MTAVVPTVVKEGDMVRLTCSTACPGYLIENPVWSRDGEAVASPTFQARLEDAGSYQCAVEPLRSNAVALDVQYLPRNTTVQVEPPGEVSRGSSVNLTCSSVANPPVHSYTWWWYSGTTPPTVRSMLVQVGTGQVLHRPSLEASQRGRYLCQARNPLGEHNASALLQMEETTLGKTFVFGLSGGGVSLCDARDCAGLPLVTVSQRDELKSCKLLERVAVLGLSGKSSLTNPNEADPMYANIPNRSLTPSPGLYDIHSHDSAQAHDSQEGEIAYSTIGNFRETRPVKHRDSNVNLKEQPFESPEAGEAGGQHVIYSTVAEAT